MQVTDKTVPREAYEELSRKWAIPLLKDIFLGCERFSDFLEVHCPNEEKLSNRVLADQLRRLESVTPLKIKYSLTEMGLSLNKFLYEKVMVSINLGIVTRDHPCFKGNNIEEAFGMTK